MKRRTLLVVGVGAGTLLALAGGTLALLRPGLQDGRLSPAGREVFAAVAQALLDTLLPADAAGRANKRLWSIRAGRRSAFCRKSARWD